MTIDQLINVLVTIALVELMVAVGLGTSLSDVTAVAKDWRLLGRAIVANYVCVPAAALGLLLWFGAAPMVAAGFLIASVCPGAPYGPPFTAIARGNVGLAVGLMVLLAASSAVAAPLLLRCLLPVVAAGSLRIDAAQMIATLLTTQLLPLFAGLIVSRWRHAWAARLIGPARRLAMVLNLAVIGLIVAVHFSTLLAIRPRGYWGMFALVIAAMASGWLLGKPGQGNREAMAISTAVRNVGVGLVIATNSFPGTSAVTATLAFALFQTIVIALFVWAWGRLASATPPRQHA